jgi:predicted O-methyltransferase YrrM
MPAPLANLRFRVGTRLQMRRAAGELRAAANRATTADAAVAAAFATAGARVNIAPAQMPQELTRLAELAKAAQPQRVLEIGTGNGGTLYVLAWASAPGAAVLSLDRTVYPTERQVLYKTFVPGRHVDVWEADSHLDETRDRVAAHFHYAPLDLLFIDGDHTYDSVRRDYELYAPLVRENGLIAFHDIVTGPYEAVGDAPRFWHDVRTDLTGAVELVESWEQGGYGIGVGYGHGVRQPTTNRPSPSTSR